MKYQPFEEKLMITDEEISATIDKLRMVKDTTPQRATAVIAEVGLAMAEYADWLSIELKRLQRVNHTLEIMLHEEGKGSDPDSVIYL